MKESSCDMQALPKGFRKALLRSAGGLLPSNLAKVLAILVSLSRYILATASYSKSHISYAHGVLHLSVRPSKLHLSAITAPRWASTWAGSHGKLDPN